MEWQELREKYPKQWVLVEALQAHSKERKRIIDKFAVINNFSDSTTALKEYLQFHRTNPERELYVLYTGKVILDIDEREWVGVRGIR